MANRKNTNDLQALTGIGPNLARDLEALGFQHANELHGKDPEKMYADLCDIRGEHIDRCVLYAFRCAVYAVSTDRHDPELLKWWNWKDGLR